MAKVVGLLYKVTSSSPTPSKLSLVFKWIRVEGKAYPPRVRKLWLARKVDSLTDFLVIKKDIFVDNGNII